MSVVHFACDYCGGPGVDRPSEYARKKRHFCRRQCYTDYRREILPTEEQNAYKGGITPEQSRAQWAARNAAKMAAMRKARQQRELNAPGSHTKAEWEAVKAAYGNQCADHDDTCKGPITKDHIEPLANGGSNDADNLQPLCKSHNSRKWRSLYVNFRAK